MRSRPVLAIVSAMFALVSILTAPSASASEDCNLLLLPGGPAGWQVGAGCPTGPCDPPEAGVCEMDAEHWPVPNTEPPAMGAKWYCVCEGPVYYSSPCVTRAYVHDGATLNVDCLPVNCPSNECEIEEVGSGPAARCECQ